MINFELIGFLYNFLLLILKFWKLLVRFGIGSIFFSLFVSEFVCELNRVGFLLNWLLFPLLFTSFAETPFERILNAFIVLLEFADIFLFEGVDAFTLNVLCFSLFRRLQQFYILVIKDIRIHLHRKTFIKRKYLLIKYIKKFLI